MASRLNYANKLILAPMVRVGTLPTRLLALDYGADIVYSEELIDYKLLKCERVENDILNTVDFTLENDVVVFRTCAKEKKHVVLQMGTADPQRALQVAKLFEKDVAAIDVNMGCPKAYSTSGGMGAALITRPNTVKEIMTTLVQGVSIPVTCKIRILPKLEDTLALVKIIESTGVAALGVHGRLKEERPRHPVHCDVIRAITEHVNLPIIANGGSKDIIKEFEDIEKFRKMTGAASVMIAREAQWNVSIFCKDGKDTTDKVIKKYLRYAIDYDNRFKNTKYCVCQIMHEDLESTKGKALQGTMTMEELCRLWEMEDYLKEVAEKYRLAQEKKDAENLTDAVKKRKLEDGSCINEMNIKFMKSDYEPNVTPKSVLSEHLFNNRLPKAVYETEERESDRRFKSVLCVNGEKYSASCWEKSKKFAEQSTAAVCLRILGLPDGRKQSDDGKFHKVNHQNGDLSGNNNGDSSEK